MPCRGGQSVWECRSGWTGTGVKERGWDWSGLFDQLDFVLGQAEDGIDGLFDLALGMGYVGIQLDDFLLFLLKVVLPQFQVVRRNVLAEGLDDLVPEGGKIKEEPIAEPVAQFRIEPFGGKVVGGHALEVLDEVVALLDGTLAEVGTAADAAALKAVRVRNRQHCHFLQPDVMPVAAGSGFGAFQQFPVGFRIQQSRQVKVRLAGKETVVAEKAAFGIHEEAGAVRLACKADFRFFHLVDERGERFVQFKPRLVRIAFLQLRPEREQMALDGRVIVDIDLAFRRADQPGFERIHAPSFQLGSVHERLQNSFRIRIFIDQCFKLFGIDDERVDHGDFNSLVGRTVDFLEGRVPLPHLCEQLRK